MNCEHYLSWTTTSNGEINEVCIDYDKRTIKRCNRCKGKGGEQ